MDTILWLVLGAVLVAALAYLFLLPSLDRLVDRAAARGDMAPVIGWIAKKRTAAQPDAYNHAIRRLWDAYQRPHAVPLIRELARNFTTLHIAQYWLDQLLKVEPELASKDLGQEFVRAYFQPQLAAQCGKVG